MEALQKYIMKTRKEIFFPQLYIAADESSNMAQASFLFFYKLSTACLILAVIFSVENAYFKILPVLSALFFLASLAAYTYAKSQKLQDNWYRSRAIAESIKTATWRLIMSAQPFNSESEELNLERFKNLLDEFLTGNKTLGALLSEKWQSNNVITERMIEVLRMSFEDKKDNSGS